jgi:hypothetical protein
MDVETPIGGTNRIKGFALERKKTSCRGNLAELNLDGACALFNGTLALEGLGTSPRRFMTSSFLHECFGRWTGQFGTRGSL